jgi:hypothetical protein
MEALCPSVHITEIVSKEERGGGGSGGSNSSSG